MDDSRIDEVQFVFQVYEIRLQQQNTCSLEHSTNITYCGVCDSYDGFVDDGYASTKSSHRAAHIVVCHICNRIGHEAAKCFKRFDIQFHGVKSSSAISQAFVVYESVLKHVSIICDACKVRKL